MRVAVAGATGRVGRHVVAVLEADGHEVVPIARRAGVDVVTCGGLAAALSGVACVVDATSGPSPAEGAATEFFTTVARNLQKTGARAGVRRIVVVSIVGIDRFDTGYMAAKRAHERAARAGPLPVEVVRAAQFHEFVGQLVEWGTRGAVSLLPRMRTRLVAARTVAETVAALATAPASVPVPAGAPFVEVAGPREEDLVAAARRLVRHRGQTLRIEPLTDPTSRELTLYEAGALLPGPGALLGGPTFDAWNAEGHLGQGADAA